MTRGTLCVIKAGYNATCGICQGALSGMEDNFLQAISSKEARKMARKLGWSRTDAHGWVCPKHSRKGAKR